MRLARTLLILCIVLSAVAFGSTPGIAHDWDECNGWEQDGDWGNKGRYCEIREMNLPASSSVKVDAGRNGGIRVTGTNQSDIDLQVRIQVWDRSENNAMEIAKEVEIVTDGGRISAKGPDRDSWSVSFRLSVPQATDLDLVAHNGGISIEEVTGQLRAETHNGGLSLAALSGDVRAETTNGGVRVELTGDRWEGKGMDVETRNGGVKVSFPENYSAELETGTVNGGVNIDFPVTVQGQIGRSIETTLGDGGAPIRVVTKNGGVTISQH